MQEQLAILFRAISELNANDYSIWNDHYGQTEFAFINSIVPILSRNNSKLIVSEYLDYCIPDSCSYVNLISIGGFSVHNKGKIEAQDKGISLSTIPIPLSNDSFGTNRCSSGDDETCASYKCIYPSKVYFCVEELLDFGIAHSINGIGEFIGLYYSYIDFCLTHDFLVSDTVLHFIISTFREQIKLYHEKRDLVLIRKIAIGLVFKCLIMRISDSQEIGCCVDHFFARVFEDKYSYTHGKSVYLGSILSSIIFTNWDKWGLNTEELINCGISSGIITNDDIWIITKIDILEFVSSALKKRPLRDTTLRKVNQSLIESSFNSFKRKWAISN